MAYEVDLNRAGSSRLRNIVGLMSSERTYGREGAAPRHLFYELEPARVISVDITNTDVSKIGTAVVRPLYSAADVPESNLPTARPLDSNVKSYPLKNEIVIVVTYDKKMYYTQRLNYLNLVNQNSTLDTFQVLTADEDNKNQYSQTSAGNPNLSTNQDANNKLGLYFVPDRTIQSLLPMEGDIIYEGRFGNSIRFGGSVPAGTSGLDKRFNGTWAIGNKTGSPITIIRNGQAVGGDNTKSYVEDINKDPSSVYLTNGQIIPFKPANSNQKSWKDTAPTVYDGNQVIIASDRIILNAKKGEFIVFSTQPIGFSTAKSFLVDAGVDTIFNSPKIYLGLNSTEHLVLGDKTKTWLSNLVTQLTSLIDAINQIFVLTGTGRSTNVQASGSPAVSLLTQVKSQLSSLNNQLPTLLSKQNFTL